MTELKGYHAHVYYDPATRPTAERLRDAIISQFAVRPGAFSDEPIGPHPISQFNVIFETEEFQNADYLKNAPNRCYFCKTELYTQLEKVAPELGVETIVNGANLDDRGDYRPGMQAARQHGVRSPLIEAGLTKSDVRALALHWGLPVWDKPATPCLSSRIAYGLEVTPERVGRVDQAERYLRQTLQLNELRVRPQPADRIVLHGPLGLRAVKRILQDLDFAERVAFDAHRGFRSHAAASRCKNDTWN